jgi:hypothetical protein
VHGMGRRFRVAPKFRRQAFTCYQQVVHSLVDNRPFRRDLVGYPHLPT